MNLKSLVNTLEKELQQHLQQAEKLRQAIAALGGQARSRRGRRVRVRRAHPRRRLSKAARAKIAAAQRRRWQKVRAKKAA